MDNIKQRIRQIEILALTLFMIILVCFLTYIINESENIFFSKFTFSTSTSTSKKYNLSHIRLLEYSLLNYIIFFYKKHGAVVN